MSDENQNYQKDPGPPDEKPDGEDMQKLMRISSLLQLNQDASAYLVAEFRFQKLIADIYKILGDVAGIDIDALTQA